MIGTEIFEGESLDYRPNRTPLPCPACDRMPVAVFFDYSKNENDMLVLDTRTFDVCHVKKNLAYVHIEITPRGILDGCGYRCPTCGFEPTDKDELTVGKRGPHSDQNTYICPECDAEDWNQGWAIEWSERYRQ